MSTAADTERDERLAQLINQLTAQLQAGQVADVDGLARQHPELADELRELWAIAQFAQLAKRPPLISTIGLSDGLHPELADPDELPADQQASGRFPREFGDFELLGELGRGGMGVVYKARQKSLNRLIALKMVREAHLASSNDRARFQAEAVAAGRLHHPNIVTVHEVGTHDQQAFFCMEYVEGPNLSRRVALDGPLPPREAAFLVATIARAVHHAHTHGILHRDLKPSNILLQQQPDGGDSSSCIHLKHQRLIPKVTDFGLAKQIDRTESLTGTGNIVGTPSYMAPEQATARKEITTAADVYSLGAILYELLTGRPPFRAANQVDTLLMVLEQEPIPPRDLNPSVPRDLELVCLKCLQKPPELRYPNAAALATDLEAFLNGEPMSVQPGSLGSFVSRMLRETHHAGVLENWGLLWMWHSLMIFLLCLLTQLMAWAGWTHHGAYLVLWTAGLLTWGTIFWRLRRRGGPVLFVERQIAHAWAGSVIGTIALFIIEVIQDLPSLTLSPVLGVLAAMVFLFKAGTLSGQFYLSAAAYLLTAVGMARWPGVGHLLFGAVSAVSFFLPGLKYYRQRQRGLDAQLRREL